MRSHIRSAIGRLLSEISWEGNATPYRYGGQSKENVLTTEVFQALDFLPRQHFLAAILQSVRDAEIDLFGLFAKECERAEFSLLPGEFHVDLLTGPNVDVQPDVVISTPSVYCIVEAKRIKPSTFQPNQIHRSLLLAHQEAQGRQPLLLLVLGSPPPIKIAKHKGRYSVVDAFEVGLADAVGSSVPNWVTLARQEIAWITWNDIQSTIRNQLQTLDIRPYDAQSAINRIAVGAIEAIDWHS